MSFQIFTMELLIDGRWMVVIFVTLFNLMNQPVLCVGKYDFEGVPPFHQVYVRINAVLNKKWWTIFNCTLAEWLGPRLSILLGVAQYCIHGSFLCPKLNPYPLEGEGCREGRRRRRKEKQLMCSAGKGVTPQIWHGKAQGSGPAKPGVLLLVWNLSV